MSELSKYSTITGFNLAQVEMDYLQHLFLVFLSRNSSNNLIFKGGTALQKAYGLNRFSRDLDFTQSGENNISELIEKTGKNINDFGYPAEVGGVRTLGRTFILKIRGPLYTGVSMSRCSLRIEISQREKVLLKPKLREIVPIYPDLQPYTVLIMDGEEILAEKVRAIMTRNKPRDIFDLNFLLKKGVRFNIDFINRKMEYFKEKYDHKKFIEKLKEKQPVWQKELKNYVRSVTEFGIVFKEIITAIGKN